MLEVKKQDAPGNRHRALCEATLLVAVDSRSQAGEDDRRLDRADRDEKRD